MSFVKRLSVLVAIVVALSSSSADADWSPGQCGEFGKVRWETTVNPDPGPLPNKCPDANLIYIHFDKFDCVTGEFLGEETGISGNCQSHSNPNLGPANLANNPAGKLYNILDGCDTTPSPCTLPDFDPQVEMCDGLQSKLTNTVDKGCGGAGGSGGGETQHQCQMADPYPVFLTSGRMETQPITVFAAPAPEGASFELAVKYGSHLSRHPLDNLSLKQSTQTGHFLGENWTDNFSDRLMISVVGLPTTTRTWVGFHGTVTFLDIGGGVWKSAGNRYELVYLGASSPQWMVRTTETHDLRQTWLFEEVSYTGSIKINNAFQSEKIGRLKRFALTTGGSDVTGSYGYDVTWGSDGEISSVTDTLGRQFLFTYRSFYTGCNGTGCKYKALQYAKYKSPSSPAIETIATFQYAPGGSVLERIVFDPIRYRRFLYWDAPTSCKSCSTMISHVIVPGPGNSSTPAFEAPVQSTEIVLERHEYLPGLDMRRPLVARSSGPGRSYAYVWSANDVVQLDLNQPTGACSGGCAADSHCFTDDQTCYVANTVQWNAERLPTLAVPKGSSTITGSGNPESREMGFSGGSTGTIPQSSKDSGGATTSYGYDSKARIRCIVRGDDDNVAFANPSAPDTSDCAGPSTAQIIRVDFGVGGSGCPGGTITKTTPTLIGTLPVTETECLDASLRSVSTTQTGYTKTIDGTLVQATRTTTRSYDTLGRITVTDGPLEQSVALDKTTTTYYTSFDSTWPHNFGRVHQVTQYVGTSISSQPLTTTFEEYDLFGVPHRITDPNGATVTYADSNNRLNWTINRTGSTTSAYVGLNPDGSVLYTLDADGICLTFEYSDANGYVGAPTKVLRSDAETCGLLPIESWYSNGELEIRTYHANEPDRLKTIERRMNGATQFTFGMPGSDSYLQYDRDRRLTAIKNTGISPYSFAYTDVIPSGETAPGGPGPASWRTESTFDELARPTSLLRYLDGTNKQTYSFGYASSFSPRPTQLTRGYNGSSTSVSTFTYDDFGRLVEAIVPEAGTPGSPAPTRYEYDVANQLIKKRVGVGTALVRTSQYSYDSLGRLTFVDHDVEHPVNCASAPAGTPIQDEEYKYDTCSADAPPGVTCTNAMGRLTSARAIIQCGSSNQVIKRGRWYSYSGLGNVNSVSYATIDGTAIGSPATSVIKSTNAGREYAYESPLNWIFGTQYTIGTNGQPYSVATSANPPVMIAPTVTYKAFGPVSAITTSLVKPVGSALRTLKMINDVGAQLDYRLDVARWHLESNKPLIINSIALLDQNLQYTQSGLLATRSDVADRYSSRYYGYDPLARLTCEARGDATMHPTSADCSTASSRIAGLFSYGDGQSAASPPDVRLTSFLKSENTSGGACSSSNQCYASSSTETASYLSGSGQLQGVTRSTSSLVVSHDALGRRIAEYDNFDATRSRRDYTHLPNGQLGSVAGQTWSGTPYNTQIRYDERGRPITISASDLYELYWDDHDRLIAASITFPAVRGIYVVVRWHYHWLGQRLIAATQELVDEFDNVDVKRFWAVTDERGFVYRLVDEQAATFWQARWDSTGWRTFVGTPQAEMWVPFALPGQVLLGRSRIGFFTATAWSEGTEAFASGAGGTWTRPPIAVNQWRSYEPTLGAFLEPDGYDKHARLMPEGYLYGRANFIGVVDRSGLNSDPEGLKAQWGLRWLNARAYDGRFAALRNAGSPYLLESSCRATPKLAIHLELAVTHAAYKIETCAEDACLLLSSGSVRRAWIAAIRSGLYACPAGPFQTPDDDVWFVDYRNGYTNNLFVNVYDPSRVTRGMSEEDAGGLWKIYLAPRALNSTLECTASVVAHEAGHGVMKGLGLSYDTQEKTLRPLYDCFDCPNFDQR